MPKMNPKKCGRCGKKITFKTWVHSRHSESYYCRDLDACGARAKKKQRADQKEAA